MGSEVGVRSCIACRGQGSSEDLLRLVLIQGRVIPDRDKSQGGRGAWIHPNCFELAVQRRSFNREFKTGGELETKDLEIFLTASGTNLNSLIFTKEQK